MKNIIEAKRALTDKPMLATSVERILLMDELKSNNMDLPQPIRFARFMTEFLDRVSTPVLEHDLIAGRCVDRLLTEKEEEIFQSYIRHPENPHRHTVFNSGHCTFSWEYTVNRGIVGLVEDVKEKLTVADGEKKNFYDGMLGLYLAIQNYILRYSKAAKCKGMTELSDTLFACATQKPSTFRQALQLLWIITLINCAYISSNPTLTLGRLDKILYPYYDADIKSGVLTREEAKELITDYYCKHNLIMGIGEHQLGDSTNSTTFDRIFNFDAPQYLILGGDSVNELTHLFCECIIPEFKNPVVVIRYYEGMDGEHRKLWTLLCEKAIQSSSLMFYNDTVIMKTLKRIGIPEEDAKNYEHYGCNWFSLGDNSTWMQSAPRSAKYGVYRSESEREELDIPFMRTYKNGSWPQAFVEVMTELKGKSDITIEDFYNGFFEKMSGFIDKKLDIASKELEVRKRAPSRLLTYRDCFLQGSIQSGECHTAGAKYHFQLQAFQMFGTVADCFTVVDKLVFIDKSVTLSALLQAVECDFKGYEKVREKCLEVLKYGSDSEHANMHARRLSHTASDMVIEKSKPYLEKQGLFLTPSMQSDTWHLAYGIKYGATPDGRKAGTPFSQNARPSNGACVNGITGMLNSMLSLPDDGLLSGALNLDIDPNDFGGEKGVKLLEAVLGVYFNSGGLHAQVSCADVNKLIDAQKHPDRHRDLRVRVTGYSGIFVDMNRDLQNDIIARFGGTHE